MEYLIYTLIVELVSVGDVFAAHGVVHVGFDAARRNGVDGDLLVAKVCGANLSARFCVT